MSSAQDNGGKESKRKQRKTDKTTDADVENGYFVKCCWQDPGFSKEAVFYLKKQVLNNRSKSQE